MPVLALTAGCAVLGLLSGPLLRRLTHHLPAGSSLADALTTPLPRRRRRRQARTGGGPTTPLLERPPLLELVAAATLALTAAAAGWTPHLPALLYLAWAGVALAVIDLEHRRLPDALVLPSYLVGAALLCLAAAASSDLETLVRAAAGLAGLWTAYLVLALLQPSAMGFGDVKLAGLLGMHLGYLGWPELVVGGAGAYVLGAPLALALLLTRRAGRGTPLPFGPLMLLGAGVGIGFGDDVVGAYAAALTS